MKKPVIAAGSQAKRHAKVKAATRMASRQLDRLADKTVSRKEQAERKRSLLEGPEEFQDARVDRRKRK